MFFVKYTSLFKELILIKGSIEKNSLIKNKISMNRNYILLQ